MCIGLRVAGGQSRNPHSSSRKKFLIDWTLLHSIGCARSSLSSADSPARRRLRKGRKKNMPGSDDTLRIASQFDIGPIQSGMKHASSAVEAETEVMNSAFRSVVTSSEQAFKKVEYGSIEARHAMHGLGEEIGVHVPRFVQSFVAELGGVGPVLAAAFTPIALVGLLDVAGEAIEKFKKWNDLSGTTADKMEELTHSVIRQKDSLDLENIRLGNVLAKLEGKPENRLALAFEEAKIKADELGESIAKDLVKVQQLLSSGPGTFSAVFLGKANVSSVGDSLKPLER